MTRYRIWTRHENRRTGGPSRLLLINGPRAGRIVYDSWQMYPEGYTSKDHAEHAAEMYKRGAPLRQFVVLPDGEQPA